MTADPKLAAYSAWIGLRSALWYWAAETCCEAATRAFSRSYEAAECAQLVQGRVSGDLRHLHPAYRPEEQP